MGGGGNHQKVPIMVRSFPWLSSQGFRMSVEAFNAHDDGERGKDAATVFHVQRAHDDRWTLHDSQESVLKTIF